MTVTVSRLLAHLAFLVFASFVQLAPMGEKSWRCAEDPIQMNCYQLQDEDLCYYERVAAQWRPCSIPCDANKIIDQIGNENCHALCPGYVNKMCSFGQGTFTEGKQPSFGAITEGQEGQLLVAILVPVVVVIVIVSAIVSAIVLIILVPLKKIRKAWKTEMQESEFSVWRDKANPEELRMQSGTRLVSAHEKDTETEVAFEVDYRAWWCRDCTNYKITLPHGKAVALKIKSSDSGKEKLVLLTSLNTQKDKDAWQSLTSQARRLFPLGPEQFDKVDPTSEPPEPDDLHQQESVTEGVTVQQSVAQEQNAFQENHVDADESSAHANAPSQDPSHAENEPLLHGGQESESSPGEGIDQVAHLASPDAEVYRPEASRQRFADLKASEKEAQEFSSLLRPEDNRITDDGIDVPPQFFAATRAEVHMAHAEVHVAHAEVHGAHAEVHRAHGTREHQAHEAQERERIKSRSQQPPNMQPNETS